jgi:hypothetical protein
VALAVAAPALAGGGPTPGVVLGSDGVRVPGHALRYVALSGAGGTTTVAAIRARDGSVVRWRRLDGSFGIPMVAFDGSTDGVSADGRTLVLSTFPAYGSPRPVTRFAVLRLPSLRPVKMIELTGLWAFDAISPNGRTIVAAQYASADPQSAPRYRVRAIDVLRGVPYAGAIVDKREPGEQMAGIPLSRAFGKGRAWAYTLYLRPSGSAFVHALDTVHRVAFCIDLPWRGAGQALASARLALGRDGVTLLVRQAGQTLAEVDLATLDVTRLGIPRMAAGTG